MAFAETNACSCTAAIIAAICAWIEASSVDGGGGGGGIGGTNGGTGTSAASALHVAGGFEGKRGKCDQSKVPVAAVAEPE